MEERQTLGDPTLAGGMGRRPPWLFRDRADAGRQLAARLAHYRTRHPVILALPRGGVPVAAEIADILDAPLEVFPVRKLGAPGQPEFGIGAIALGGASVLNTAAVRELGISSDALERVIAAESAELARQSERFRGGRPLPDLGGRTVVIVDDGLATGASALAAIRAVQTYSPARLALAVPVCAPETESRLRPEVDDIVCIASPSGFFAVGLWYREFGQVSDGEVHALLQRSRRAGPVGLSHGALA